MPASRASPPSGPDPFRDLGPRTHGAGLRLTGRTLPDGEPDFPRGPWAEAGVTPPGRPPQQARLRARRSEPSTRPSRSSPPWATSMASRYGPPGSKTGQSSVPGGARVHVGGRHERPVGRVPGDRQRQDGCPASRSCSWCRPGSGRPSPPAAQLGVGDVHEPLLALGRGLGQPHAVLAAPSRRAGSTTRVTDPNPWQGLVDGSGGRGRRGGGRGRVADRPTETPARAASAATTARPASAAPEGVPRPVDHARWAP